MHPALLLSKNNLFCINPLAPKISYVCQSAYWYLATPHSTRLPEKSRGTVVMTAQVARFGDVKGCSCRLVLARLATVMQIPPVRLLTLYMYLLFSRSDLSVRECTNGRVSGRTALPMSKILLTPNVFLWVVASNISLRRREEGEEEEGGIVVLPFVSSDQMIREVLFAAE